MTGPYSHTFADSINETLNRYDPNMGHIILNPARDIYIAIFPNPISPQKESEIEKAIDSSHSLYNIKRISYRDTRNALSIIILKQ